MIGKTEPTGEMSPQKHHLIPSDCDQSFLDLIKELEANFIKQQEMN